MFFLLLALHTAWATTATIQSKNLGSSLRAELITGGSVEDRLAKPDDAHTVIYYLGEQSGSLAPCGCADRPRGGLPRAAAYMERSSPGIRLNTGNWLDQGQGIDGRPRPDSTLKNQWMVRGLQALQADAIHVAFPDIIGLATLPNAPPDLPLVSANLSGPGIQSFIILHHNERTIGITGISHPGHATVQTPGFTRAKPFVAAASIIEQLREQTDIIVLFSHGAGDAAKRLAKNGSVDVVIDSDEHRVFEAPFRVGKAVWVRSHAQGLRLGELRLGTDTDNNEWVLDRKIDLDDTLSDHESLQDISKQADAELKALQKRSFRR